MAITTKTRNIDGHIYQVTTFTGTKALTIGLKLAKMLGESIGNVQNAPSIEPTIADFLKKIDPVEIVSFIRDELLEGVLRDNREIDFDMDFVGDELMSLWKVISFVIEVNYGRFFDDMKTVMTGIRMSMANPPKETKSQAI